MPGSAEEAYSLAGSMSPIASPAPTPEEVDEAQLAAVVGSALRRDDDLDDHENER